MVEVDHGGEYLRLRAGDENCISAVRRLLDAAGYVSELLDRRAALELEGRDLRWYPVAQVGDLSREEAEILAQEIVPAFLHAHSVGVNAEALQRAVASGLEKCFLARRPHSRGLPTEGAGECGAAVAEAASSLLPAGDAELLGQFTGQRLRRFADPEPGG